MKKRNRFRRRRGGSPRPATPPVQDNILKAAQDRIESQLTPANRANYEKVVVAGLRVGLDGGPDSIIASIRQSKDPVKDAAIGAVNLVMMLRKQSRDTMPAQALVPGATTLMLNALDFAERLGLLKVTRSELARATHILGNYVMRLFGVTTQNFTAAAGRVQGIVQDPTAMELLARRAGVVKSPLAGTPTPTPATPKGIINVA